MATIVGDERSNTLVGTNFSDRMFGYSGNDFLNGRAGDDAVNGGSGRDTLTGGSGNDTLSGGAATDRLVGGAGRDVLNGGLGQDLMTGGTGADVFVFDDGDTGDVTYRLADVITDFGNNDTIDLTAVEVLYLDYGPEPARGGLSVWEAAGNIYVSWNTFGTVHDIQVEGFAGTADDLQAQIRWYDDDNIGRTATTATIGAGQTRIGTLDVPEDQDWFRITLTAGRLYNFHVGGAEDGFGTAREPMVALYDSNGNYLDDDFGYGEFPYLAQQSGTYFLEVSSFANVANATYRLGVTSRTYADDHGDTLDDATHVNIGSGRNGILELRGDVDAFSVTLEEGTTYQIDMTTRPGAQHPLEDPLMELVDEFGNYVTGDDDSGDGLNARIIVTAEADGTYYIGATSATFGYGAYNIHIAEIENALTA